MSERRDTQDGPSMLEWHSLAADALRATLCMAVSDGDYVCFGGIMAQMHDRIVPQNPFLSGAFRDLYMRPGVGDYVDDVLPLIDRHPVLRVPFAQYLISNEAYRTNTCVRMAQLTRLCRDHPSAESFPDDDDAVKHAYALVLRIRPA